MTARWTQAQYEAYLQMRGKPITQKRQRRARKQAQVLPPGRFACDTIVVILPLPDRRLHPNGRASHWLKARLVEAARMLAYAETRKLLQGHLRPRWGAAEGHRAIYMGRAVRPDGDDLGAWFKAYIDGMADAGVVANDREIRWAADTINSDRGQVRRVEITIRPLTESEHG